MGVSPPGDGGARELEPEPRFCLWLVLNQLADPDCPAEAGAEVGSGTGVETAAGVA